MRKLIVCLFLLLVFGLTLASETVTLGTSATLRSKPGGKGSSVTNLAAGNKVTLNSVEGDYAHVKSGQVFGYVPLKALNIPLNSPFFVSTSDPVNPAATSQEKVKPVADAIRIKMVFGRDTTWAKVSREDLLALEIVGDTLESADTVRTPDGYISKINYTRAVKHQGILPASIGSQTLNPSVTYTELTVVSAIFTTKVETSKIEIVKVSSVNNPPPPVSTPPPTKPPGQSGGIIQKRPDAATQNPPDSSNDSANTAPPTKKDGKDNPAVASTSSTNQAGMVIIIVIVLIAAYLGLAGMKKLWPFRAPREDWTVVEASPPNIQTSVDQTQPVMGSARQPNNSATENRKLFQLLNEYRRAQNLPSLNGDESLMNSAALIAQNNPAPRIPGVGKKDNALLFTGYAQPEDIKATAFKSGATDINSLFLLNRQFHRVAIAQAMVIPSGTSTPVKNWCLLFAA